LLWKNIQRLKSKFGKEFDIAPMTFLLPEDYRQFAAEREREHENLLYILKPAASSCGRGIRIIGKKTKIGNRE